MELLQFLKIKNQPLNVQKYGIAINKVSIDKTNSNNSDLLEKILRNKDIAGLVNDVINDNKNVKIDINERDERDENLLILPIEDVNDKYQYNNQEEIINEERERIEQPEIINEERERIEQPEIINEQRERIEQPEIINEEQINIIVPITSKNKTRKIRIIPSSPDENNKLKTTIEEKIILDKSDKPKKKKIIIINDNNMNNSNTIKIKNEIMNRLPQQLIKNNVILKTSKFYLNNRKLFIKNFNEIFKKYENEIKKYENEDVSCDSRIDNRELFIHQKIVRDYLNTYTPYRGLLIYHGLGSGKTCTSIAIAEGMKSDKRIFIMTPASLKMNYFSELKKCGDDLYKKKQYWEFISTEGQPEYLEILSNVLSLPESYINHKKGAWMVNVTKNDNYETLTSEEQKEIDTQLNIMIRSKYTDINYNGLNNEKIDNLTQKNTINPFDNSVVIIDEAHNFVSRIVNSIKKREKNKKNNSEGKANLDDKPTISMILYHHLMNATNIRIVLLSGTPIINYPNEVAVLFNILRGYIKTWTFEITVNTDNKITKETILQFFKNARFNTFDYIEYSGNKLIITRNPFGFINTFNTNKQTKKTTTTLNKTTRKNININGGGSIFDDYDGVILDSTGNISDEEFKQTIKRILELNQLRILSISFTANRCLPDIEETFFNNFISLEKTDIINKDVFKRRILGLTSYFRSSQEKLLPRYIMNKSADDEESVFHIIKCPMSEYQFTRYVTIRETEIQKNRDVLKMKTINDKNGIYLENSTYRIYSRAVCNFAFPNPPGRPLPLQKDQTDLDEDDFDGNTELAGVEDNDNININPNQDYLNRIRQAMNDINTPEYLSREQQLTTYSPKFAQFLDIFKDNDINHGCHLLYSNFRTIEGIGLLRLILLNNGYEEFKIHKTATKEWEISNINNTNNVFSNIYTSKRFVLYTGTETAEEKEIIRNIYNGDWDLVPSGIVNTLRNTGYTDNLYGEVIRLFMITASGSEGINLRNVRFVHIIEPYWNLTRIEQIIGRARRICSHSSLPEELRTVKVFMYITVFDDKNTNNEGKTQIEVINEKNMDIKLQDTSRLNKNVCLTTDESLMETSEIKNHINTKILTAIKETAIDCRLYENAHSSENLKCFDSYGLVTTKNFGSYPTIQQDIDDKMDVEEIQTEINIVTIKGKKYKYNKQTTELFENNDKNLDHPIGKLIKVGRSYQIIT